MTRDANLKIVRNTASERKKHHGLGCEYIHIEAISGGLTVYRTPRVRRELRNKFIVARNRKRPRSTKAFVGTVREIEHYDVVSSWMLADECPDNHPWEWTKQALINFEEAMEPYLVEVTAKLHCQKRELMSCRFSTCLQLWQGKEVGYSWNSPTCA